MGTLQPGLTKSFCVLSQCFVLLLFAGHVGLRLCIFRHECQRTKNVWWHKESLHMEEVGGRVKPTQRLSPRRTRLCPTWPEVKFELSDLIYVTYTSYVAYVTSNCDRRSCGAIHTPSDEITLVLGASVWWWPRSINCLKDSETLFSNILEKVDFYWYKVSFQRRTKPSLQRL